MTVNRWIYKFAFTGIFILVSIALNLSGQELTTPREDSARLYKLLDEAQLLYIAGDHYEALNLAGEAHQLSMQTGDSEIEGEILKLMGDCYFSEKLYTQAIPYYLRSAGVIEYRQNKRPLREIYASIASCYQHEKLYDKEAEYYLKSLDYTPEADSMGRTELFSRIGTAFLLDGRADTSIVFFLRELNFREELDLDKIPALLNLVRSYRGIPDYDSCIFYSQELFTEFSEKEDYRQMSTVKNNIGYYFTLTGNYASALENYNQAISFGEKAGIPVRDLAIMTANTGVCYQNMNREEKAKTRFNAAIDLLKTGNFPAERSGIENILALIYFNENDLYNAGEFSKKSLRSAEESGNPGLLAEACYTYSQVLKEGNDPELALEYYEKYLNILDSLDVARKLEEQRMQNTKADLEKSENDLQLRIKEEKVRELAFEQLFLQLEKEEQAKSLLEKDRDLQVMEQERLRQSLVISRQQHLVEQQEREKQILEQEQRITNLKLEQEERKQAEQEQEIRLLEQQQRLGQLELDKQAQAKKALTWIVILMILVALLILGYLITARRKNLLLAQQKKEIEEKNLYLEQQNEEIMAQRDEIEAQRNMVFDQKEAIEQYNSEIMKSIEYAKRIQAAALPELALLEEKVSEHFLLFRPRDIVSGDFYWVGHVEGKTIVIVSDCTGHGVPGAFMSILGTSLIKEIILKEYLTHPGVILRRLRKEIINALGQKGISGEQKDGMDMALLSLDHENGIAQYAGAYNSLYLIRDKSIPAPEYPDLRIVESDDAKDLVLYDIPADKMPIAHFDRMDKFNTREFSFHKNDLFYLFTDGFADQFGGVKGKKFMYKPFKRLILSNASKKLAKQQEIFSKTLDDWMGDYEQIDDICVLGLKI